MVVVPPGTFTMGSPESEEFRDAAEGPRHAVTIRAPFAVGVYEVTFAEWDACVRMGGCRYTPADRRRPGRLRFRGLSGFAADGPCSEDYGTTAPVGSFAPNAFGLYDVLGNVSEWTQDCWNDSYAGAPADGSAWEFGDCDRRVLRGGSWFINAWFLRSANRSRNVPDTRDRYYGFRVARTLP